MKLKSFLLLTALGLTALLLAACNGGATTTGAKKKEGPSEVVIYSGRKEKYIKPVVEEFEKATGIKVKLLVGDGSQLANQLIEEKNNPRADVFVSNDAGTLGYLVNQRMLQKYESKATKRVSADLKESNGMWVGASARARVIMYNTNLVKEDEAPKTLMGLTDPKWKGKLGLANSTNESVTGHVSTMRILKGDAYTEKWLKDLKANEPLLNKSHDPIRDAVGNGELHLGLVNSYYYAKKKAEGAPVAAVYPDQDDFGTIVNVAGAGVVKGAKNIDGAHEFIDFILSDKIQKLFAGVNKEMPVVEGVPTEAPATPLSDFKRVDVKLDKLGDKLDKTLEMLEKYGM